MTFSVASASSLVACDGSFSIVGSNSTPCTVTLESGFPYGHFQMQAPATCPFNIPYGPYRVNYGATADFRADSVQAYNVQYEVTDRSGRSYAQSSINTAWNSGTGTDGFNRWYVTSTGTYYAGWGGFDSNDKGYDDLRTIFVNNRFESKAAISHLTYKFGSTGVYNNAPNYMTEGEVATIHANTNDPGWTSPITWSWYLDGTLAQSGGDYFDMYAGVAGSNHQLTMYGTDSRGLTQSSTTMVTVGEACGTMFVC